MFLDRSALFYLYVYGLEKKYSYVWKRENLAITFLIIKHCQAPIIHSTSQTVNLASIKIYTLTGLSYQYRIPLFLSVEKLIKAVFQDKFVWHLG